MTSRRLEQLRIGALSEASHAATVLALDNVCRLAIARLEFLESKQGGNNVIPLKRKAEPIVRVHGPGDPA